MARRTQLADPSEFYCTKCGKRGFDIPRKRGQEREAGHLKRLWCLNCKEEHNHVECKPWTKYDYSDFLLEFKRFTSHLTLVLAVANILFL